MISEHYFLDYIPAKIHEGKRWYIDYYVKDPTTKKMKRKQIKINRIKSIPERRRFAKRLVQKINIKLSQGWNPIVEQEAGRSFFTLSEGIKVFLDDKKRLRKDTYRDYIKKLRVFENWALEVLKEDIYLININKEFFIKFFELRWSSGISEVTYNNEITVVRTLFFWLMEHNYCKVNHAASIKKKRAKSKTRCMNISISDRETIRDYWTKCNKRFLGVVYLTYHCLIRPKEITYLKGRNVNLENQTIIIDGSFAKNHNTRIATIPNVMIDFMKEIMEGVKDDDYLFSRGIFSGRKQVQAALFSVLWRKGRDEMNIDKDIQLYSLRDSGIIQKIKDGLDIQTVMSLADHSSLSITSRYVSAARQDANIEAVLKIRDF